MCVVGEQSGELQLSRCQVFGREGVVIDRSRVIVFVSCSSIIISIIIY